MPCSLRWRAGRLDEMQRCKLHLDEWYMKSKEREVTCEKRVSDTSEIGTYEHYKFLSPIWLDTASTSITVQDTKAT